jgi:predicted DsbA family dithiol-disulfide isomerase
MELGLDFDKINAAVTEHHFTSKITPDQADGQALGVRQTLTFFVNGRQLARLADADLRTLIEDELKR